MTDRITAQEAYSNAKNHMDKKVGDFLGDIYACVRNASQNGSMKYNTVINIPEGKYRDKLSDILKQDGFECSYNGSYSGEEIITISWNQQK